MDSAITDRSIRCALPTILASYARVEDSFMGVSVSAAFWTLDYTRYTEQLRVLISPDLPNLFPTSNKAIYGPLTLSHFAFQFHTAFDSTNDRRKSPTIPS